MKRMLLKVAAVSLVSSYAGAAWAIRRLDDMGLLRDPRG